MVRTTPKTTTFRKRKACVTRKIEELCILCDVKACAVIVGPDGKVSTWPENHIEVKSVVDRYRNFIGNTKKKGKLLQEEGLEKELRSITMKKVSILSDWDESWLNEFTTMESLSGFLKAIGVKIHDLKKRSAVLEAKYCRRQHDEIHEETMQLQPIQAVPDFDGFSYNEGFDSNYETVMFNDNGFGCYPMPLNYDQGAMNFCCSSGLNGSGCNSNEMLEEIKFDYLGDKFTNQGFNYCGNSEINYNLQPDSSLLNNGNPTNNYCFMSTPNLHNGGMNLPNGSGCINDGVILEETKLDYVGNCCINELGFDYRPETVCLQPESVLMNNGNSTTNHFMSLPNLHKESMNLPYGSGWINDGVLLDETKFDYSLEMVSLQPVDSALLDCGNSTNNCCMLMPNLHNSSMNLPNGSSWINDSVLLEETKFDHVDSSCMNHLRFDLQPPQTIEGFLQQFGYGGSTGAGSSRGN